MNYSVYSIPGLPCGYKPLSSRFYHNPYPFMRVLEGLYGKAQHFEEYIWPREVNHPISNQLKRIPWLGILIYYLTYQWGRAYRQNILSRARRHLEACLHNSDLVFVITHSHGNTIFINLMEEFEVPKGKKIVWLSQAPAYKRVLFGLVPPAVTDKTVEKVKEKMCGTLAYRIKTDCLSGDPGFSELTSFKPLLWEHFFLAHAAVRDRKDILEHLKKSLLSMKCLG